MLDYAEIVDQVQRGLGKRYAQNPDILNVPGVSIACKIDPYYYLAAYRGSLLQLATWCLVLPDKLESALIRTASLVTRASDRCPSIILDTVWGEGRSRARIKGCFLDAEFVDRALMLYGGRTDPLPLSGLALSGRYREKVVRFLEGKTPVQQLAFA